MPKAFRLHRDYDNPTPDDITDDMIKDALRVVERGGSSMEDGDPDYYRRLLASAGPDRVKKIRSEGRY